MHHHDPCERACHGVLLAGSPKPDPNAIGRIAAFHCWISLWYVSFSMRSSSLVWRWCCTSPSSVFCTTYGTVMTPTPSWGWHNQVGLHGTIVPGPIFTSAASSPSAGQATASIMALCRHRGMPAVAPSRLPEGAVGAWPRPVASPGSATCQF